MSATLALAARLSPYSGEYAFEYAPSKEALGLAEPLEEALGLLTGFGGVTTESNMVLMLSLSLTTGVTTRFGELEPEAWAMGLAPYSGEYAFEYAPSKEALGLAPPLIEALGAAALDAAGLELMASQLEPELGAPPPNSGAYAFEYAPSKELLGLAEPLKDSLGLLTGSGAEDLGLLMLSNMLLMLLSLLLAPQLEPAVAPPYSGAYDFEYAPSKEALGLAEPLIEDLGDVLKEDLGAAPNEEESD